MTDRVPNRFVSRVLVEFYKIDFLHSSHVTVTCGIYDDVQTTKVSVRFADGRKDGFTIRYVERQRLYCVAVLFR